MKRIYLAVLSTIYIYNVVLVTGFEEQNCFKFTLIGAGVCPKPENINCTAYNEKNPHIPCIEPVLCSRNIEELQDIINQNPSNHTCELDSDNVCIRYTYKYNSAVVNVSFFCGKVTEDLTTAVRSDCYTQYTQGYAIEACACKSKNDKNCMPYNSTVRNICSILIIFMATAVPLFYVQNF